MHWPKTPVERLQRFYPPYCPNEHCPQHHPRGGRPKFHVHTKERTSDRRRPRRFQCPRCKKTCSRNTFSLRNYLKRPELLLPVAAGLIACSGLRQIARSVGCSHSTVSRLSARLGRHCLLLLARALEELEGQLDEPITFDHLETFEFSQDFPFGIATAAGSDSWFVYGIDPAPHRRAGRRSPEQTRRLQRRARRPRKGGYTGSTRRMLDCLLPLAKPGEYLQINSDDKPQYRQAVQGHRSARRIRLTQYPNPPRGPKGSPRSPEARRRDEAMFAVDSLHSLIRHSVAAHKRETLAFGKRLNAVMERMFLVAVWRNFVKWRSERKPDPTTPAMRLGLTDECWSWKRVFSRRLLVTREKVPEAWLELYRRDWLSPMLASNSRHRLRYAP